MHLGILTSFQLRLREALRWVSAIPGSHTLCAHLKGLRWKQCGCCIPICQYYTYHQGLEEDLPIYRYGVDLGDTQHP